MTHKMRFKFPYEMIKHILFILQMALPSSTEVEDCQGHTESQGTATEAGLPIPTLSTPFYQPQPTVPQT